MNDNPLYAELDRLRTELAATCSCRFVPNTCDEQVIYGELQRCDYHRDLWTVLSETRQQLAEAQVSCAEMRKALEMCYWSIIEALPKFPRRIDTSGQVQDPLGMSQAYEVAHGALATDAGKALLERMAKQQKALEAWQVWCLSPDGMGGELFEQAIGLMDEAIGEKETEDASTD